MHVETTSRAWFGRWVLMGWIALAGCGDDVVALTESATGTGTGTGTTQAGSSSSGETVPTTTEEPPTSGETDGTVGSDTIATTTPTTGDTTQGVDTTGTTTSDTDTTTDTTGGSEVTGHSVSQTVNAGHLVTSPNFRLVYTLGQPTQNQGTTISPNFRLHGGLVGANGSPP